MTDKEKKERDAILLEIQSRKEVLKKIDNAYKRLKQQAEANYEKRKTKVQAASEYGSVDEAHDAWGYDCITEKEYLEIVKIFEQGEEYVGECLSPQEVAVKILGRFIGGLNSEIRSFEFELLPPEEQARLLKEQEERREKIMCAETQQ